MQNPRKTIKAKAATSKYKGVRWVDAAQKWKVEIHVDGKNKHVCMATDEDEAARKYNQAAKRYFGDRAVLNDVPPLTLPQEVGGGEAADSYKLIPPNNRN